MGTHEAPIAPKLIVVKKSPLRSIKVGGDIFNPESSKKKEVLYCEKCKYPVKPDVVFFGESLPS